VVMPTRRVKFQSALPQRSDGFGGAIIFDDTSFNPRSRKGATSFQSNTRSISKVSIRAPAKERQTMFCRLPALSRFQSALPQRSDFLRP